MATENTRAGFRLALILTWLVIAIVGMGYPVGSEPSAAAANRRSATIGDGWSQTVLSATEATSTLSASTAVHQQAALVSPQRNTPALLSASMAPAEPWFGALQPNAELLPLLRDVGVSVTTLEVAWKQLEPDRGHVNQQYVAELRDRYAALRSSGFRVVLDTGLQYPPSWVFGVGGQTRFVNQYGSVFTGRLGNDIPDAVFNAKVREAQASYLGHLAGSLGALDFMAVRVGGLGYGELRYPLPVFGDDRNSYWAFGAQAQERSPVPGWYPGSPDASKAQQFLDWYLQSLADYGGWLAETTRGEFPSIPHLHLLLPSWGIRPGEIQQAAAGLLSGSSRGERQQTINQGLDWERQLSAVSTVPGVQASTTWLEAPPDGVGPTEESPIAYVARISEPYGIGTLGENSGDNTAAEMQLAVDRVRRHGLVGMLWMSAPSLSTPGLASWEDYRNHTGLASQPAYPPVGLVDTASGRWTLREGPALVQFHYGNPADYPFLGDWNCDGIDTPGLYRQSDGYVYLRNANTQGIADVRFFFGNPGDIALAGDFDGDGCDTVSIYRPSEARFYVINRLGKNDAGVGPADYSFLFGKPGDKPVVGDWDGDGVDEIGLHRESAGLFYYRNTLTTGVADGQFYFGDPGDRFVAGDWGGVAGQDTPAVFRPSNSTFYFRNTLTQGAADSQHAWAGTDTGSVPVAGVFQLD